MFSKRNYLRFRQAFEKVQAVPLPDSQQFKLFVFLFHHSLPLMVSHFWRQSTFASEVES